MQDAVVCSCMVVYKWHQLAWGGCFVECVECVKVSTFGIALTDDQSIWRGRAAILARYFVCLAQFIPSTDNIY